MIAVFGGRTPVVLLAMMAMMLFAGAAVGANQAANGAERVDLSERLNDELFTEDGELKERNVESPPETMPIEPVGDASRDLLPETPRLDAAMRQYLVIPLLRGGIWVSEVGFALGYSMTTTLGADVTRLVLNGGVVATVAGVGVYVYRMAVATAREVGA